MNAASQAAFASAPAINARWLARCEAQMADRMEARARIGRIKLRTERRERVNRFMGRKGYWPLLDYLAAPVRTDRPLTLDTIETVTVRLRRFYVHELAKKANRHFGFEPGLLTDCRKRLIVARYFAKFGKEIWAQEAA